MAVVNFIKEYFELLLLADLIIFQIVIICSLSTKDHLDSAYRRYVKDKLDYISKTCSIVVNHIQYTSSSVSRIEHALVKKKRVNSVTYWVDNKAYWLDEDHVLHPLEEPED